MVDGEFATLGWDYSRPKKTPSTPRRFAKDQDWEVMPLTGACDASRFFATAASKESVGKCWCNGQIQWHLVGKNHLMIQEYMGYLVL